MRPILRLAAVAAALIVCFNNSALAQTAGNPPQAKPAAPTPAKPKPQAKPAAKPAPKQTAEPDVPGRKSVCVLSALGHEFRLQKIGLTIFGNALEKVAIDSWGIDDAAVKTIANYLGKEFIVRRISVKAALPEAVRLGPGVQFRASPVDVLRAAAASAPRCDYYTSITPKPSSYNGTNQFTDGLGIVDISTLFDRVFVFASFTIELFDGTNFARLGFASPQTPLQGLLVGPGGMYRQVDKTWWPATPQAVAQSAQLKNASRTLVEEGLKKSLPRIFEGAD